MVLLRTFCTERRLVWRLFWQWRKQRTLKPLRPHHTSLHKVKWFVWEPVGCGRRAVCLWHPDPHLCSSEVWWAHDRLLWQHCDLLGEFPSQEPALPGGTRGVVFSVDYNDEPDILVKGSEDFAVKLWALFAGTARTHSPAHGIGHRGDFARVWCQVSLA